MKKETEDKRYEDWTMDELREEYLERNKVMKKSQNNRRYITKSLRDWDWGVERAIMMRSGL